MPKTPLIFTKAYKSFCLKYRYLPVLFIFESINIKKLFWNMRTLFTFLLICFSTYSLVAQAPAKQETPSDAIHIRSISSKKSPVRIYNATDAVLVPCQAIYREHPVQDYKIVKKDFFHKIDPTTTKAVDAPIQLWSEIGVSILIEVVPSRGIRVTVFEDQDPNTYKSLNDVKILKRYLEPYNRSLILEVQPDYSILFK